MKRILRGLYTGLLKVFCAVIFFVLFVPIGKVLRMMKKNRLSHPDKKKASYWTVRV